MNLRQTSAALFGLTLLGATNVFAQATDQGGFQEKFKGGGDKEPPECQLDVPSTASAPFFVEWNCKDNFQDETGTPRNLIRSALWIRRPNDTRFHKIDDFIGFPASVQIDESILGTAVFTEGLPVSFRLEAKDRAGIATISATRTVSADTDAIDTCTLTIATEATDSTGSTTGLPAMSVQAIDAAVVTQQDVTDDVVIVTPALVEAQPCEIDSACQNQDQLSFEARIDRDSDGTSASGTISIDPGASLVSIVGTQSTNEDGELATLDLSGTTTIDGATATVSLDCRQ